MEIKDANVLLVDDDPSAIHAMRTMLSDCANLRFASSGTEALRSARAQIPDLMVLDTHMPGMSGLEVCAAMKRDSELSRVPIIMATAHDAGEVELAAIERGVADFIAKPLSREKFRARVKARLRERQPAIEIAGARDLLSHPSRLDRPVLMIVDDDVAAVQMLGSTLQDMGVIHFVTSGGEAIERAQQLVPDLVLLDSRMPDVDGFEVCEALQADERLRQVPIVFVTRYDDTPAETRALDLGAADFISKPYTAAVLRARVRNLLDLKLRTDAQLRAESERWRQLADARVADVVRTASDAILSCDEGGRVLLANAAAARLFDTPVEALVGVMLDTLLDDSPALVAQARLSPRRVLVARQDGSRVALEATASDVESGGRAVVTLVLRDVTDRERLEAETRARAAAEASSQAKTRMIGVIAHEMGNPLNALLGFTELLQIDRQAPLAPRHQAWVREMSGAAGSLKRLLDDLIEFARNEATAPLLQLRGVDLADCVAQVLGAMAPIAAQAGVELLGPASKEQLFVTAEPQRLVQCLTNLVSNGIKYNHRGGNVQVSIVARTTGATLQIVDDGMGMDDRQLAALFEPFNRLGREQGTIPGTGLGLVITRQLVLAMHGELGVQSRPGEGSCFTIELPYA